MSSNNRNVKHLGLIPLWEKFTKHKLLTIQKQAPRMFARGFQQKEIVTDELTFISFSKCRKPYKISEIEHENWLYFAGVDLSSTKRDGNVITVLAYDKVTGYRIPVEIIFSKGKSNEIAMLLSNLDVKYNFTFIAVENNAYQQAIIDWIQAMHKNMRYASKIIPYTTTGKKLDPEIGLPSLENEFALELWLIPYGEYESHGAGCACSWCRWDSEFAMHPTYPTNDAVMSTWFARQALMRFLGKKQSKFNYAFDESGMTKLKGEGDVQEVVYSDDQMMSNFGIPTPEDLGFKTNLEDY